MAKSFERLRQAGNGAPSSMVNPNITMDFTDFDFLLQRMALLEQAAFAEFEDALHAIVPDWLREWGLAEEEVERETPACLLALAVLVVQRRAEIKDGRVLVWLRIQTRNLTVRYWRETDQEASPPTTLTANDTREHLARLDGGWATYTPVARQLGVSPRWLRRWHRRQLLRLAMAKPDAPSFQLST